MTETIVAKRNLKKIFVYSFLVFAILGGSFFGGLYTYSLGFKDGYTGALVDVSSLPGVDFTWTQNNNGSYTLVGRAGSNFVVQRQVTVDCLTILRHVDNIVSITHNAGTLTDIGKDWIEQQLSGAISANITKYISCDDTDASGLSAASTQLTSELDANGFTRAAGTYASTGAGTWTVTKTFTSSGTQAVQTYGLQFSDTKLSDNNLFAYDTSAVKNTVATDTLQVQWSISVT